VCDKRSATFIDGQIECDYILPDNSEKPPLKYLADEDYEFRMAHLQRRDGDWYPMLLCERSKSKRLPLTPSTGT
jgi:hypothetical protein